MKSNFELNVQGSSASSTSNSKFGGMLPCVNMYGIGAEELLTVVAVWG